MKALSWLAAILISWAGASAQDVVFTVNNLKTGTATLLALSGEKTSLVDSVMVGGDGTFSFHLTSANHRGLYRVSFDRGKWIDFVNDGEDVEILSDAAAPTDSLNILRSESNRRYYAFRRLNQDFKAKTEILQLVLARYPHGDPYYSVTRGTAAEVQRRYSDFIDSATIVNPSSFVSRYIRSAQLPVLDLVQAPDKQLAFLKAHALDNIDFTDEGLVHSDLFTGKAIEYLMYYRNPQLPKELLAKEFNSAVDSILNRAKANQTVYKHITGYLIDGFKQFGFEECINYILENYVIKDDLCLEGSGNTIQRMIDQRKRLAAGTLAPGIVLPDTSGAPVSLMEMKGEKTLVLFYSTACPHCQRMIPRISEIVRHEAEGRLAVLAVSLDESRADWLQFVAANKLSWRNVNDPAGWGGRAAADYCIYATPTMILLDREKRIIARPLTPEDLQKLP